MSSTGARLDYPPLSGSPPPEEVLGYLSEKEYHRSVRSESASEDASHSWPPQAHVGLAPPLSPRPQSEALSQDLNPVTCTSGSVATLGAEVQPALKQGLAELTLTPGLQPHATRRAPAGGALYGCIDSRSRSLPFCTIVPLNSDPLWKVVIHLNRYVLRWALSRLNLEFCSLQTHWPSITFPM